MKLFPVFDKESESRLFDECFVECIKETWIGTARLPKWEDASLETKIWLHLDWVALDGPIHVGFDHAALDARLDRKARALAYKIRSGDYPPIP